MVAAHVEQRHLRDDGPEQVGSHGQHVAHQQPAVASAHDAELVRRGDAPADQVFGDGYEVLVCSGTIRLQGRLMPIGDRTRRRRGCSPPRRRRRVPASPHRSQPSTGAPAGSGSPRSRREASAGRGWRRHGIPGSRVFGCRRRRSPNVGVSPSRRCRTWRARSSTHRGFHPRTQARALTASGSRWFRGKNRSSRPGRRHRHRWSGTRSRRLPAAAQASTLRARRSRLRSGCGRCREC